MTAKPLPSALHRFFWGMPRQGREQFARRARSKYGYLRTHLIPPAGTKPTRTPRVGLMQRFATASLGQLDLEQVLAHFHPMLKTAPARRSKRGRKEK